MLKGLFIMSFYNDEAIKLIEKEFKLFQRNKSQYATIARLISIIAPNNTYKTPLYSFAYHGIIRRIKILNRCIENIFHARDFSSDTIPSETELSDITINLQCFIINIYGVLENLAWVYAICIDFQGSIHEKSFFSKKQKLLNTLSDNIRVAFVGDGKWFEHIKNIRDLLAHQEPFYIPPYSVIMEKQEEWKNLEQKKWDIENNFFQELFTIANVRHTSDKIPTTNDIFLELQKQDELYTQKKEAISQINEEQKQYVVFQPMLVTNTNKKNFLSIQFYPQILIDIKTVYEKIILILEYIVTKTK